MKKQESTKQIERPLIASKVTKADIIEFAKPKVLPPIVAKKDWHRSNTTEISKRPDDHTQGIEDGEQQAG